MKVKLKQAWFAPSDTFSKDKRSFSGQRYKKGVHELPDELAEFLPVSAEIIDAEGQEEGYEEKVEQKEMALSEVDFKTDEDVISEKMQEAEENFKNRKKGKKK